MVEVAVAVILRTDGAFLLAQRPAGKVYAGWWEFPGGKIEAGEPAARALTRELREELGIDVRRAHPWITRVYAYEHATVRLNFFRVTEWSGEAHPKEDQSIRWQRPGQPMAEPMLPANAPVLASLALPHEYAITSTATYGVEEMLARVERRLAHGLKLLRVREPELGTADYEVFAGRVIELAGGRGARVIVKSGSAVSGASGVHYSAAELMRLEARPKASLAGASCHCADELRRACELELDFALLGAVMRTTSHTGAPTLGWEGFARIARGASIPVYAIGGLRRENMEQAWAAGAHGIAMIRGSWTV